MQAKQAEESPFFIGQRKSGTLVWHEQIDQAPQNVETSVDVEFRRQPVSDESPATYMI
jgi:hypothetical protein